jgi:hypothetical protein
MKTLAYPLAVTCFTRKQCDALMKAILKAGLSALGVMNTMPHMVVYGPYSRQGPAVKNLYTRRVSSILLASNGSHKIRRT